MKRSPVHRISIFAFWLVVASLIALGGPKIFHGFDFRGPFLLFSPFIAIYFVQFLFTKRLNSGLQDEGDPPLRDTKFVQEIALEYGFGKVRVGQRRIGDQLTVYVQTLDGKQFDLPNEWAGFDNDTRRYSVVRGLRSKQWLSIGERIYKASGYFTLVLGMIAAGLNLWSILGFHIFIALCFAYAMFRQLGQRASREDVAALRLTRDLKAALAYVRQDPLNLTPWVSLEIRIAALEGEAARLSIA